MFASNGRCVAEEGNNVDAENMRCVVGAKESDVSVLDVDLRCIISMIDSEDRVTYIETAYRGRADCAIVLCVDVAATRAVLLQLPGTAALQQRRASIECP